MRLRNPELKDKERMMGWMKDPRTKTIFATDFASFTDEKVENFRYYFIFFAGFFN